MTASEPGMTNWLAAIARLFFVKGLLTQREMELCFDPVTAKVTAATMAGQPASPQVDWLRDDDPVLLRQQLALACKP
jgi:hypothetical protein